jgi:UDP-N-acetylglucosamine acyltransferase
MKQEIHPSAIIGKDAIIGKNVKIGPFAVVVGHVTIGDGTVIDAGAQILDYTDIGKNCHIFSYAVVGSISQDLKYKDCRSYVKIGDNNTIREFVTINRGTDCDSATIIGKYNHIMAYSHVAHDCSIGDHNILANCATLAGHVTIGDYVVMGGLSAVHQFCRVGQLAIIGGCTKVVQDVPPYSMCDGHPAQVRGINLVGLRRAGYKQDAVSLLKKAYKIVFFDDHPFDKAKELVIKDVAKSKEVSQLLDFISLSKRGITR